MNTQSTKIEETHIAISLLGIQSLKHTQIPHSKTETTKNPEADSVPQCQRCNLYYQNK